MNLNEGKERTPNVALVTSPPQNRERSKRALRVHTVLPLQGHLVVTSAAVHVNSLAKVSVTAFTTVFTPSFTLTGTCTCSVNAKVTKTNRFL